MSFLTQSHQVFFWTSSLSNSFNLPCYVFVCARRRHLRSCWSQTHWSSLKTSPSQQWAYWTPSRQYVASWRARPRYTRPIIQLFLQNSTKYHKTSCAGGRHTCPRPCNLTFYLESGVRVTCDVGYLCANFSSSRPLCSRLRPDVRYRQTSDAYHRLMPPTLGAGA